MGYVWDKYGLYIDLVWINCGPTVDQLCSKGIGFALFLHGVTESKQVKSQVKAVQQVSFVHCLSETKVTYLVFKRTDGDVRNKLDDWQTLDFSR